MYPPSQGISVLARNFQRHQTDGEGLRLVQPSPTHSTQTTHHATRPWEKLGTDIFEFNGKKYLMIVDYYSRFPVIRLLSDMSSHTVCNHFTSVWNLNTCMLTSTKKQTRNNKRSRPNSMTVLEPSQWISRAKYTREPENTWDPGARTRSCLCPAGSNSCTYGGANTQTHRCIWGQSQFHHTSHWRQDWPEGRLADTRPATLSTAAL